jgi:hypothetical protein
MTSMSTVAPPRPIALTVDQLQRAIAAVRRDPAAASAGAIAGRQAVAVVVGAHATAGASIIALAVAEAVASEDPGTKMLLAEDAAAVDSGLSAATEADLGESDAGWRLGRRGDLVIACRSAKAGTVGSPELDAMRTVVDVGTRLDAIPPGCPLILVCRPTVPSLRLAERALAMLPREPVVAAVGPARWPRLVRASAGPRVAALRDAGRVVHVPVDRRLAVTGLTSAPLPKPLRMAGRSLLRLLTTNPREES